MSNSGAMICAPLRGGGKNLDRWDSTSRLPSQLCPRRWGVHLDVWNYDLAHRSIASGSEGAVRDFHQAIKDISSQPAAVVTMMIARGTSGP